MRANLAFSLAPSPAERRARRLESRLRRFAQLNAGSRLLQVGGGKDAELLYFSTGVRYIVEGASRYSDERADFADCGVQWIAARPERLPFDDGSLDVVLLTDVLDDAKDPAAVLAEARRVLAPGGLLWIVSRVAPPASGGLRLFKPEVELRRRATAKMLTEADLDRACRAARFRTQWRGWQPQGRDGDVCELLLQSESEIRCAMAA